MNKNIPCGPVKYASKWKAAVFITRRGEEVLTRTSRVWIERFFSHRSRWQGFPEELIVVLVDFLNFFLTPATHSVTDVRLEAEPQRHHGITDAERHIVNTARCRRQIVYYTTK